MNQHSNPALPVVLSIAGFDPSAGAGIAADLKTLAANNCYGVAAITAITVQNTLGISSVHPTDPSILKASILALQADGHIKAIKIGMLANRANCEVVREVLDGAGAVPAVLDTVVRSSSGTDLIDSEGLAYLCEHLLRRVSVVTPNLQEASLLAGQKVDSVEGMKAAARRLIEMGARAVVVTGGHLDKAIDVFHDGVEMQTFVGDRVKPDNTHGTGCTFSTAIAANLALGRQMGDAIVLAKAYVTEAIRKAFEIGPGRVPLNHLYRMFQTPRIVDHSTLVTDPPH